MRILVVSLLIVIIAAAALWSIPNFVDLTPKAEVLLLSDGSLKSNKDSRQSNEQFQFDEPTFKALRAITNEKGIKRFALDESYAYLFDETCEIISVPEGFVTDFASIPGAARILFNPADYAEAALVHDWLYASGIPTEEKARKKADTVFKAMLEESGVATWETQVIFQSVRHGGKKGFGRPDDFVFWDFANRRLIEDAAKPDKLYVSATDEATEQTISRMQVGSSECLK